MNEESGKRTERKPSAYLVLAVVGLTVLGLGFGGVIALSTEVASHVSQSLGSTHAVAVSGELGALTQGAFKSPQNAHSAPAAHGAATTHRTVSGNWGGYATNSTGGTITEAFGEWFVPAITCSASHRAAGTIADQWVGIDGYNDGTVEQAGTYEYCPGAGSGGPYYWTWFEFYPYNDIQSVSSALSPGDLINVYILYNPYVSINGYPGIYTLVVNDLSNNASNFAVTGNPAQCNGSGCESGLDQSAECISEYIGGLNLAKYGTEQFVSCDATIKGTWSGIGGFSGTGGVIETWEISQSDGVHTMQTVTKLSSYDYKNDDFTMTWKRAT